MTTKLWLYSIMCLCHKWTTDSSTMRWLDGLWLTEGAIYRHAQAVSLPGLLHIHLGTTMPLNTCLFCVCALIIILLRIILRSKWCVGNSMIPGKSCVYIIQHAEMPCLVLEQTCFFPSLAIHVGVRADHSWIPTCLSKHLDSLSCVLAVTVSSEMRYTTLIYSS